MMEARGDKQEYMLLESDRRDELCIAVLENYIIKQIVQHSTVGYYSRGFFQQPVISTDSYSRLLSYR